MTDPLETQLQDRLEFDEYAAGLSRRKNELARECAALRRLFREVIEYGNGTMDLSDPKLGTLEARMKAAAAGEEVK